MRILVTAFAMDAHFNGVVPLAWALRTAGHEVRVASQPALRDSITRAGLTAVPVGADHRVGDVMATAGAGVFALHSDPDYLAGRADRLDLGFLSRSAAVMTASFYSRVNNPSMVDDLVSFARHWRPDLVLWEPFTFAGAVAARCSGAAHARVLWGPDLFLHVHDRFLALLGDGPAARYDDPLADWLDWTAARHGGRYTPDLVRGDFTIDQMPADVRLPTAEDVVPMRYVPYNGPNPAVVPPWLRHDPDRPRICLTQGVTSRATGFPGALSVHDVLDAVDGLGVELVATLSADEREHLPALPSTVRVVDSVPLHALLPGCAGVIHHGGAGTWATAAACGVPQLSFAWMWDDVVRSVRLAELGAGRYLPPDADRSVPALRAALASLLEPPVRDAADGLGARMRAAPSPNDVVPGLERRARELCASRSSGAARRAAVPVP